VRVEMGCTSWRIGVEVSNYHIVEVQANSAEEACALAIKEVKIDDENFCTGNAVGITSCLINDRHSRDFSIYVPETYPEQQKVI
jgi:hypothetical protein